MFTADDIKEYVVYEIEPVELCELLGFESCKEIARMIRKSRKSMGYDEELDQKMEALLYAECC